MLKFAVNSFELGHNLGIDFSGNILINELSKSANIVEFINSYMKYTGEFIYELSKSNKEDIINILSQFTINYLKFKKSLIEKCYQSIDDKLKFYVLLNNYSVEKEIEIMDKIIDFNFSYIGQNHRISINVYDVSDYESSDFDNNYIQIDL